MNVAVLMTCHNRRETTLRCLESLACAVRVIREKEEAGRDRPRWRLFVVDDGSTDGTDEAIREYTEEVKGLGEGEHWGEIHLIRGDGTLYWAKGMALAWNEALRYEERVSSSAPAFDFFLWLNDDTILRPDALLRLLRSSAQNRDAVVAGSLIDESAGSKTCGVVAGGLFTGNFVLIPRSVYEKVGLICGRFHHAWADSDYARHCQKEGVEIVELEGVGTTREHDLRPSLKGVSIGGRIRLLFDPKGWCVHDLWLYRKRNWGLCVAIASSLHLIFHVLKGER